MAEIILRAIAAADLETVLRQRREMFLEMGGRYAEMTGEFEAASRSYFGAALHDGTYTGVLAEKDGAVVGGGGIVIAAWPGSPMNTEPRRAWILNIWVEPEYRRRGIARRITEALIEWCRKNGFRTVALHSSEDGRALYEKLGFTATNEMRLIFQAQSAVHKDNDSTG